MVFIHWSFYVVIAINVGWCRGGRARAAAACAAEAARLAAVERFFSLVFAEFQRAPPACVCVQMCAQHPTYCYPNGCLRRDAPTPPTPPTPAPTALHAVSDAPPNVEPVETEKLLPLGLRSERYHDFYKIPYKNSAKTGLKYSAREQLRHKSIISMLKDQEDQLSVVKSRWPMKKYYGSESASGNDLSRGESLGRNYFFNFYDDKDTVMLNQNAKRATNYTRLVLGDSRFAPGLVVRVGPAYFDVTTDPAEVITRLYQLDLPRALTPSTPNTPTTTHSTHSTHSVTHNHTINNTVVAQTAPTTLSTPTHNESTEIHAFYT